MEINPESISQHYRQMSDDELTIIYNEGGLTEEARKILTKEIASREIDLRAVLSNALIDKCYGYETLELIKSLETPLELSSSDSKLLDLFLSCVGMATALMVVHRRYGENSRLFCDEIISKLSSRLSNLGLPKEILSLQLSLIEKSYSILKNELPNVNEYTAIDLTSHLLKSLDHFDHLDLPLDLLEVFDNLYLQSSRLHLWLFTIISDIAKIAEIIISNAEEKYNFSP